VGFEVPAYDEVPSIYTYTTASTRKETNGAQVQQADGLLAGFLGRIPRFLGMVMTRGNGHERRLWRGLDHLHLAETVSEQRLEELKWTDGIILDLVKSTS
jgi:hypothetical protein